MAKVDPRAEPVSQPPAKDDDFSVDRVAMRKVGAAASSGPAEVDLPEPDSPEDSKHVSKVTSQDPRYEPLEKLLDKNDWKQICTDFGPMDDVGKLPPNLGLVAALASHEMSKDGDPEAVVTAIRCMAGLLGVAEDSPIARVLARRLLRKNPVRFSERKAPPARLSFLIVLVALVLGGGIGILASGETLGDLLRLLQLR
jgi:hypothetical protein